MRAALLLALAIGCGAATGPPDACDLVSPAEFVAVLGAEMKPPARVDIPKGTMCSWESRDPGRRSLTIELYPEGGLPHRDMYLQEAGTVWRTPPEPVAGVGDEATALGRQLLVVAGQAFVVVSLTGTMDEATGRAEAVQIARRALARL